MFVYLRRNGAVVILMMMDMARAVCRAYQIISDILFQHSSIEVVCIPIVLCDTIHYITIPSTLTVLACR